MERQYKSIADIGGGANPLLDEEFIVRNKLEYFLIDKSAHELKKSGARYRTIETDAACGLDDFRKHTARTKFDLIFSHMLLEHIADPLQAHRNFYDALNPGGRCVHIYPSPNNLPLMLNRVLPEAISMCLLRLAQPARDLTGAQRKFKAYYRMCGAPGPVLTAAFEAIGYRVLQHTGFIGHAYYARCRPAAMLEVQFRMLAHRFQLPLTGGCLLVLEKCA
ncbi:MAG: class I SAM-dependent methyltransferase [Burkholderiales bacterium]